MRITQTKAKKRSLTPIIILVLAVVAIAGGYFTYAFMTKGAWPFEQTETKAPVNTVNYDKPTQEEIDHSQDGKKNSGNQQSETPSTETPNKPSSDKKKISVGIAFAGYDADEDAVDIRAFTPDVIEGDGTCTATLTKDTAIVTKTSKAFVDSSSSQCRPILIPASEFEEKGLWSLTVTYASTGYTGASGEMNIKVDK